MENRSRVSAQMIMGLLILAVGVLLFLDNLNVLYFRSVLRYWPVLLIAFGVMKLVQARKIPGRVIGSLIALIGLSMTLNRAGLYEMRFRDWWPALLIMAGVGFILRALERQKSGEQVDEQGNPIDRVSTIDIVAIMSGIQRKNNSPDFKGGEITTIMGGCDVDLRGASMPEGQTAVVDVFTIMGGLDIRVPLDWTVTLDGMPILGGMDDKSVQPQAGKSKQLILRGYVILGGVEIRN